MATRGTSLDTPPHSYDRGALTDSIYSIAASRALSSADPRAPSPPQKHFHDSRTPSSKRRGDTSADSVYSRPDLAPPDRWSAAKGGKRTGLDSHFDLKTELHQSTCLNISNNAHACDFDLWILPDFDEWEMGPESAGDVSLKRRGDWAPLVERAVNSNRERLRRRLEGDGWDFVGGKHGDARVEGDLESTNGSASDESVDDEFDVVVLDFDAVLS